jgi:hypothetical protein
VKRVEFGRKIWGRKIFRSNFAREDERINFPTHNFPTLFSSFGIAKQKVTELRVALPESAKELHFQQGKSTATG